MASHRSEQTEIKRAGGGLLDVEPTSRGKHDPIWRNFLMKGVDMLLPQAGQQPPEDLQKIFTTLQNNPLRLWQLTSTRYIMGRREQLTQLMQHPDIQLRTGFRVTNKVRLVLDPSPGAPFVLLEHTNALPRAQLFHKWEVFGPNGMMEELPKTWFNPVTTIALDYAILLQMSFLQYRPLWKQTGIAAEDMN